MALDVEDYFNHIQTLNFIEVPTRVVEDKYSTLGLCHLNCENYSNNSDCNVVIGWLKQDWPEYTRFLMHSCIEAEGQIFNITTPALLNPSNFFAVDQRILVDPKVQDQFRFIDNITNEALPQYLDKEKNSSLPNEDQ